MLFNKHIEPSCTYCEKGVRISDTEVMCLKYGVVSADGDCRAFKYDPLRRVPMGSADLDTEQFSEEDFSL